MFEITPLTIIITVILSAVLGGIISRLLFKSKDSKDENSEHHFHVDSNTGIVSDITSLKY